MSSIEGISAGLQVAQAALPEDMVAGAVAQLDMAEMQYRGVLENTDAEASTGIQQGLGRARQALQEAAEALHSVSEATARYVGSIGVGSAAETSGPFDTAGAGTAPAIQAREASGGLPSFEELTGGPHTVARTEINATLREIARTDLGLSVIERSPVADTEVSWDVDVPGYAPPFVDIPRGKSSARKPDDQPDPDDPAAVTRFGTVTGRPVRRDAAGWPLNPQGRTGMAGRGMLNKWDENPAADFIVTRDNPVTGELEVVAIQRTDTGEWALPGGKDDGDGPAKTALREFYEEAGGRGYAAEAGEPAEEDPWGLDISRARVVYAGYVDDSRNTDNAWMVTTAFHRHLTAEEAARLDLRASTDAKNVRWVRPGARFFASHGQLVRRALASHRGQ